MIMGMSLGRQRLGIPDVFAPVPGQAVSSLTGRAHFKRLSFQQTVFSTTKQLSYTNNEPILYIERLFSDLTMYNLRIMEIK